MGQPHSTIEGFQISPTDEGIDTQTRQISLIITRPEDATNCPFWIGLYQKGQGHPKDIFALEKIEQVFHLLTNEGLCEGEPLMLSDNSRQDLRQYYLIPDAYCREPGDKALALILETVAALRPKRLGLYLGTGERPSGERHPLLEDVIRGLVRLDIEELYLYTGRLGVNSVLNAALRVKRRLQGAKDLQVFH